MSPIRYRMGQSGFELDSAHRPWGDESPPALLVDLLRMASLINSPMREGVADPSGLSRTELQILLGLSGEGALAGHDLAEIMGLAPMNVSRALASLVAAGLIEPDGNHAGRRRKPMRLSAAGRTRIDAILPDMAAVASLLFADLDSDERRHFHAIARKVIERMTDWMGEHHAEVPLTRHD